MNRLDPENAVVFLANGSDHSDLSDCTIVDPVNGVQIDIAALLEFYLEHGLEGSAEDEVEQKFMNVLASDSDATDDVPEDEEMSERQEESVA